MILRNLPETITSVVLLLGCAELSTAYTDATPNVNYKYVSIIIVLVLKTILITCCCCICRKNKRQNANQVQTIVSYPRGIDESSVPSVSRTVLSAQSGGAIQPVGFGPHCAILQPSYPIQQAAELNAGFTNEPAEQLPPSYSEVTASINYGLTPDEDLPEEPPPPYDVIQIIRNRGLSSGYEPTNQLPPSYDDIEAGERGLADS